MSRQHKRTRAQRRWIRKGYTHEVGSWGMQGKPYNFLLVLRPQTAAYFRKHPTMPDDFVRPVSYQLIHKGGKP